MGRKKVLPLLKELEKDFIEVPPEPVLSAEVDDLRMQYAGLVAASLFTTGRSPAKVVEEAFQMADALVLAACDPGPKQRLAQAIWELQHKPAQPAGAVHEKAGLVGT